METRANHILIGVFLLLMVAGIAGFIVWSAKVELDREYDHYIIYFDTAVTGLSEAGDVRYNGIYVGTVREIGLDEDDPSQVRVIIRVFRGTPVTSNTVATLDLLGLTGVSFIQLRAEDDDTGKGAMALKTPPGEPYPVIPSRLSGFQGLVTTAPQLVNQGLALLGKIQQIFTEQNIAHITSILANVDEFTGVLAKSGPELSEAIAHGRDTLARASQISEDIEAVTATELQPLARDLRQAAQNFQELSANLDLLVDENRREINTFTATALPELSQFATEARRFAATLNRIAEQFEAEPANFFFSKQRPEIDAEAGEAK